MTEEANIERTLGRIEGTLDHFIAETRERRLVLDQEIAGLRTVLDREIDGLRSEMRNVKHEQRQWETQNSLRLEKLELALPKLDQVIQDVSTIKPAVDKVAADLGEIRKPFDQFISVRRRLIAVAGAIGGFGVILWESRDTLWNMLKGFASLVVRSSSP